MKLFVFRFFVSVGKGVKCGQDCYFCGSTTLEEI